MQPFRRLRYRYLRWQYKREMALPSAPGFIPGGQWYKRYWRRLRHPIYFFNHWRHGRDEAKPAPPPLTADALRRGPIRRGSFRFRVRLSHFRRNFTNYPITVQIVGVLAMAA